MNRDCRDRFAANTMTTTRTITLSCLRYDPEQDDQPSRQYEDLRVDSPPESLLNTELEQKVGQALAE